MDNETLESSPLKPVTNNKQSKIIPKERRRFKFDLDESNVKALLEERRRRAKNKGQKRDYTLVANKPSRDPSVYTHLPADNMCEILQLPIALLPKNRREMAMAAVKTEKVYAKPEHWIVPKKPTLTAEEKCRNETKSIIRRMDTMKMYSRAAKCLDQARESRNQIGPIRKKRSPIFDELICDK